MILVRILLGGLTVILAVVVAVPAVALFDLVRGGTGLGLCPETISSCSTSGFAVMELLAVLGGIVVVVGGGIVACLHFLQRSSPRPS